MFWLALSCLLFSASLSTCIAECSHLQEEINTFADDLLNKYNSAVDEIFLLDDIKHGPVSLTNGKVWGLDTFFRTGNAQMDCDKMDENIVTLKAPFNSTKPLRIRYEWEQNFFTITLKGVAYIKSDTFQATAVVRKVLSGNQVSKVLELDITKLKGVEVDITGLAHVGWVVSRATSGVANLLQESFGNLVEPRMKKLLNQVLHDTSEKLSSE